MPKSDPDYASVTRTQQQNWSAGDFSVVAGQIVPVAESLVAAVDPHAGQRVLDVACGSGNVALVAARRYCEVTGLDFVPALIERAKERAHAERVNVRFDVGDAQSLPYADGAFDCVLSVFGVMFAPDQSRAARELVRVCKPGGRIGLASWHPEGSVGEFFRTVSKINPPPPGLQPPTRWGTEQGLRELFGDRIASLRSSLRTVTQYYLSVDHAVDIFRRYFGPTARALETLDADGQRALTAALATMLAKDNRATDGTLVSPLEYLESVIVLK